jgi:hypothetical protein
LQSRKRFGKESFRMYSYLKLVAAVLLLTSLALPMRRTSTHYVDREGVTHDGDGSWGPAGNTQVFDKGEYFFTPGRDSWGNIWVVLLVFAWPLLILIVHQWRGQSVGLGLRILEGLLLVLSFIAIQFASTFSVLTPSRIGEGAWLAFAALGLYAIGLVWADATAYRRWAEGESTESPAAAAEEVKQ